MIVTVTVHQEKLLAALASYPQRLRNKLFSTINRLAIEMQGYVKGSKLSGQVLHVRTGTLRRSINQEVKQDGNKIAAIVGTNVKYAGVHEYGFDGAVGVKAHVRRSRGQMKEAMRTRKDGTTYATRNDMRQGEVNVRGFTRHMHLPERSFLRSALKDYEQRIRDDITKAAEGAF
jgi:phage gpG-like protein